MLSRLYSGGVFNRISRRTSGYVKSGEIVRRDRWQLVYITKTFLETVIEFANRLAEKVPLLGVKYIKTCTVYNENYSIRTLLRHS